MKTGQRIHAKRHRHSSPLITSVSSCTSSIVGHGSAICASGIFAGSSVTPLSCSSSQRIGSSQTWRCRSCQVQFTEEHLTQVQSPGGADLSALRSLLREKDAHADAASTTRSFTNNCNPSLALAGHLCVLAEGDNPA